MPFLPPRDLPNPGIEPRFPALQVDSLLSESGKPKNTGMGSLSLLQGTFLTQELNQGLLHCRQILCQLSYQGNPLYHILYIMYYTSLSFMNGRMFPALYFLLDQTPPKRTKPSFNRVTYFTQKYTQLSPSLHSGFCQNVIHPVSQIAQPTLITLFFSSSFIFLHCFYHLTCITPVFFFSYMYLPHTPKM